MFASAWLRFGLLLGATGLFMAAATPAAGHEPRAYGERLLAQYRLPPETVARYAALAAGAALSAAPRGDSLFADALPWVGPEQRAGVGHNPYTLVFTVHGMAKAAGDVHAHWQAGWEVRESANASRELLMAMPRISRTGVAAGQPVTLTASSTRVSFRGERSVAPMLGLLQASNLAIDDVQLQVWSGTEPHAWPTLQWSRAALLALGASSLLLLLHFKLSRRTPAEPTLPAARGAVLAHTAPLRLDAVQESTPAPLVAQAVPAPPAPAAAPAPSHQARVMAALQQVLTGGLAVATVFDEARMQRTRAKSGTRH